MKQTKTYKTILKMMELDPKLMAEVMAYNNMCLEYNLPKRPDLEKKYQKLVKEAKKLLSSDKEV